jgi:crotonobetainyl-CoA:carnitine CoA-transferase CaiB-like acyl-CoA transferase
MDMADIAADPHFRERQAIVEVDGTPMQALIARLSETPGRIRSVGPRLDADGAQIRDRGWDGSSRP